MQYRLIYGMLSMMAKVLAGPVPQEGAVATGTEDGYRASPTPIDIKLDVGTLGKMFPLPPELQKLGASGEPLELKVSLGKPGQPDNRRDTEEEQPSPSIRWEGGIDVERSTRYKHYRGNGTPHQGWPTPQQWVSYNSMKNINRGIIMNSCSNNNWEVPNNTPQETDQIFLSIDRIAKATHLDRRFILAIIIQETKGCVRVHTTYSGDGVRNPGLMQSHNGRSTCNSGTWHAPKNLRNPCPEGAILGMIHDGVVGSSNNPNDVSLLKMIKRSGTGTVTDLYRAARMYNSGPGASISNLERGGAGTNSYACDVANRMTGWVG